VSRTHIMGTPRDNGREIVNLQQALSLIEWADSASDRIAIDLANIEEAKFG
jgi:hypothetical protein